jgi:hypothetical protein
MSWDSLAKNPQVGLDNGGKKSKSQSKGEYRYMTLLSPGTTVPVCYIKGS